MIAGDVDAYGASDQAGRGRRRIDRMHRGPPDQSKRTWNFKGVITAVMPQRGSHLSRPIAIQGAISVAFITIIYVGSSRPFIGIGRPQRKRNGPRWTVQS